MAYISFNKLQLINLEFSLGKELLRTNRAGSFACTTIIGCNTRKYHGLLIVPLEELDGGKHVLLSSVDESIVDQGAIFNLGCNKYPGGIYDPKGHKYAREFEIEPIPRIFYRVGDVVITKERLLVENEPRLLTKYTLVECENPVIFRVKPNLAFRNMHSLSHANMFANTKYKEVENGIKIRLYEGYPNLVMQFSKKTEFIANPHWNYNVEYEEEQKRGYPYQEDLFVPGYFEVNLKKGESVIFSCGIDEISAKTMAEKMVSESTKRIPRNNFYNCLRNSAEQFIVHKGEKIEIIAGYPWFGSWGRDTFIALPGLCLTQKNHADFLTVIHTLLAKLKNGLFPNMGTGDDLAYNSVDAPLWFIWAMQQYYKYSNKKELWKEYGYAFKEILSNYKSGTNYNICMHENGLIFQGAPGKALTWMDAVVEGNPITPRHGYAVEINALWFNAVMFSLELAEKVKDKDFINEWQDLPVKIAKSFVDVFWDFRRGYLADSVYENNKDFSVRPNMVFACSLDYSPVTEDMKAQILWVIEKELLTPKGLRTLSPRDPNYKKVYEGDQNNRDSAYHQGTVWPWLVGHFVEGYLKLHKEEGLPLAEQIYNDFEEDMFDYGLASIAEIYDGDPPHKPKGTISQAWSVAEILRIKCMIDDCLERFSANKNLQE